MIALVFLFLFLVVVLLMCVFSGEIMVMSFVNKYRYVIYFVFAAALYLGVLELVNGWKNRSVRPTTAERISYTCTTGKVSMVVLMNNNNLPLAFINAETAQGLDPAAFAAKYDKCIMVERAVLFTVTPNLVSQYLPIINKANKEGQYR